MSTVMHGQHVDSAIAAGRNRDNIVVGGEIVRHRRLTRLIHWSVALTFFIALFSGMPIWSPLFGWMAYLVGGLEAARVIHPYAGVAFFIVSIFQFVHWLGDPKTTNLTEFSQDALALAHQGCVSLLIDAMWSQPNWYERIRLPSTDYEKSIDQTLYLAESRADEFLFQFSRRDDYISSDHALQFANAAPLPRGLFIYNSDHSLSIPAAFTDRIGWLQKRLAP